MTLYCPDKEQNIIDKTKFRDNIIMKYCPSGLNFTGHNFALHIHQVLKVIIFKLTIFPYMVYDKSMTMLVK